jgi:hypothetical protein
MAKTCAVVSVKRAHIPRISILKSWNYRTGADIAAEQTQRTVSVAATENAAKTRAFMKVRPGHRRRSSAAFRLLDTCARIRTLRKTALRMYAATTTSAIASTRVAALGVTAGLVAERALDATLLELGGCGELRSQDRCHNAVDVG